MLHIINKSPCESEALRSCLRLAHRSSVILLIEDAVISASASLSKELELFTVYALQSDLKARGLLDKVSPSVNIIDYKGFVDLTIQHTPIQSWL